MGTPEFAVPSLSALYETENVVCVVTQPDRPKGRGQKLLPSPVKIFAEEKNIPVLQPQKIKLPEAVEQIAALQADLIVVAAFGQILSQEILDLPKFGCINVHASLLPKYRGAAPIEWCLINGEKLTGVTTMQMNSGLDTGDMLLKSEVKISDDMILPELHDKLMTAGAEVLLKTLEKLHAGELQPVKQDDSLSNYAPMLKKDTGFIDWNKSAREIHNLVRGLYGGAYALMNGQKIKIWRTKIYNEDSNSQPGKMKIIGKKILVGTGKGTLEILEMQAPNEKKVSAEIICANLKN